MAQQVADTGVINVVSWPAAVPHLQKLAVMGYRSAAKAPTEFERGRFAGRAEMAEELLTLPETLAVLAEEDARERKNAAHDAR